MRTIATLLLVLMAVIFAGPAARAAGLGLGALSQRLRGSRHGRGVRRLVRRRRAFSSSPRAADPPHRGRAGKQATHRRGDGALHHQQFSLPTRRHRPPVVGRLRWVSRRDGSKTKATRGRLQPPPAAPFPMRLTSCRKGRSTNGSLLPRDAGSKPSPRRRSPRAHFRSCGRRARARRCSIRGSISSATTLERYKATIVRNVAQKSSRWIPKWVDDMIAAKVINGLSETLREMRDPDHPWREQANELDREIDRRPRA